MGDETTAGVETAPHILLVEDNPLHIRLVSSMLDEIWPGPGGPAPEAYAW